MIFNQLQKEQLYKLWNQQILPSLKYINLVIVFLFQSIFNRSSCLSFHYYFIEKSSSVITTPNSDVLVDQQFTFKLDMKEAVRSHFIATVPYETVFTPHFVAIYHAALRFANLQIGKDLHYRNVKIYQNDHIHQIYTQKSQKSKLPHLVLLHGYGGTSLMYVRTFSHLKQHFQVHALDTFGVGLSSAGAYHESMTAQEVSSYYTGAIEQWRKAVGVQQFILAGHSFGGYISTLYLQKYPKRVTKLILLSPAGSTVFTPQEIKQKQNLTSFKRKALYYLAEKIYNLNIRPFRIMDNWLIGKWLTDKILTHRLKLPNEEKIVWKNYLNTIFKMPKSSESGFYKLLKWPLVPHRSIQMIAEQNLFKHPIHIFFGDHDWMEKKGAMTLSERFGNIECSLIENAGHVLMFDNPTSVTENIIKICKQDSSKKL